MSRTKESVTPALEAQIFERAGDLHNSRVERINDVTTPDDDVVRKAVDALYAGIGRTPPQLLWVASPSEAGEVLARQKVSAREQRKIGVAFERRLWDRMVRRLPADLAERLNEVLMSEDVSLLSSTDYFLPVCDEQRERRPKAYRRLGLGWFTLSDVLESLRGTPYVTTSDVPLLDALAVLCHLPVLFAGKRTMVVVRRPTTMNLDASMRWHGVDNYVSLQFSSSGSTWRSFHSHGVSIPAQVWQQLQHPETLSLVDVLGEGNIEVRRVMCEAVGWDRIVQMANLKLLDTCPDPGNPGFFLELYESARALTPSSRIVEDAIPGVLRVTSNTPARNLLLLTNASPEPDGTRRRYGMAVPDDLTDALSAAAWTFNVTAEEYAGVARAT